MLRLVDYAAVVGYDFEKSDSLFSLIIPLVGGESEGQVLQRFPTNCWDDYPYNFKIETFCQPCGWYLSRSKPPPTFFVAYLTDVNGNPYFAACLTFHEAVSPSQLINLKIPPHIPHSRVRPTGNAFGSYSQNGPINNGSFVVNKNKTFLPTSNSVSNNEKYQIDSLIYVTNNNLSLLYTVFADSLHQYSIEQMIATLLGGIEVPPTGGPRITFSLGVGDRQIIQPAHCSTIPVTRNCVALLFKHLGIHNVILLFTAILSDQKVLVCSRSLNRLTEACHALTSILYPLKYSHTYVPILPKSLIEFINAPTPFLYGIHTGYQHLLSDMVDVFVTDLDGGSVVCPENIPIPQLPDPYFTEVVENLFQILSPELMTADYIYPLVTSNQSSDLISLDKRLRAVFLRLFTSLFAGYRSCLTITRIHPKPVIHFNRTLYLLLRGNSAHNEFYDRLLSSMRFHQFILERGPPFRVCDIFDEVYESNVDDYSLFDNNNNNGTLNNRDYEYDVFSNNNNPSQMISGNTTNFSLIERLSTKLFDNEFGDQPATQILPNEAVEAHKRIHQTPFPVLDAKLIDELTVQYSQRKTKNVVYHKPEPRFVPQGLQLDRQIFKAEMFPDKYRVIHEFVDDIFNQHITEALKRRNTIRQDLKSRPMRRLFVDELRSYIIPETSVSPTVAINNFFGNMTINRSTYERRAVLTWEQFELIVDLLDEALRQETQSKDSGITPIIMDISTRLCTELGDVRYYANMSHQIQRHEIWRNMPFWESLFNEQVNNQIRLLYIDFCEEEQKSHKYQQGNQHQHPHTMNLSNGHAWSSSSSPSDSSTKQSINSPEKNDKSSVIIVGRKNNNNNNQKSNITIPQQSYTSNMSALEIAAEEMRIGHMRPREVQQLLETREESTVYSQIIHFVNLIINFRIPVHIGAAVADIYGEDTQNNDNNDGLNVNATGINVTSQINHALKTISQTEGYVKNTSRYLADNYSNNQSNSEGSYGRYSGQNVDKSNQIKLLNHITVLENWLLKFVKIVGEENNLIRKRITEVEGKIKAIIESHLINLQDIYPKVQNIPHMKKPEIANPVLLPGEIAIPIGGYDCLSCQLLPDGRYERNDYQLLDPFNSNIMNSNGGHGNDSNDNSSTKQQDSLGNLDASDLDVDLMLRPLLPAQGALFITNYRIIFTGVPKDPFQSNKVINRSFPISALYTIKKLGCVQMVTAFQSSSANPSSLTTITSGFRSATLFVGKKSKSNTVFGKSTALRPTYSATTNRHCVVYRTENLDVLLLRSLTFQMLKIGFDVGEIQPETRDELRNLLEELRYPSMMCMGFNSAPLGLLFPRSTNVVGNRTTPTDLNNNTGSNTKDYILPNMVRMRHLKAVYAEEAAANLAATLKAFLVPPSLSASSTASTIVDPNFIRLLTQSSGYLDMARFDGNFNPGITTGATVLGAATSTLTVPSNNVSVGLNENGSGSLNRSSVGAGSSGDGGSRVYCSARLVAFNVHHSLVKSYPSFLIIPQGITQNCLAKVARSHRRGRFPVVTWQHPETKAYLLRGSEIQSNVILNTFKNIKASSKNNTGDYDDNADSTLSHSTVSKEHIRYIRALIDMSMSAINSSRPSSVITSETGYLATDELSNSSQLPIVSNSTTVASSKIPSTDNLSKEFKPIINKPSPVVSNVTNNRTKSLGRIGKFAARRNRLTRSGVSPMGSVTSGLDEDLLSMDSASQTNQHHARQSIHESSFPGISSGISNSHKPCLYILCEKQMTKVLRPTTHLAAFDLWKFYLTEDLACGSIYDLDHFSPSYRKNTNRPYEPVLRQGFNNSHIEQTYAVLGLREGEEAVGWQEAWEQAQSELLNLYSSSPRKHLISKNDKSTANTQSTSNIPGSIVDTSTSTTNATSSSNTNGKTNTHVKIVHHFNQLPYRESSEPIESLSHHKLVTSDYSMTKRRAVSSGLLDTNQTNSGLLSSLTTTSSSTTYPLTNELTQTLTPQGGSNGSIDLDSTFVNCSEIITTSSIPVSERHSNDTTQSQLIIVKNPTMKDNSESHLSTDMNPPSTNSTTITVRTIKGSNHSKTEEILKSSDDRIINGTETKTRTTNNGTTDNNFNVIKTNYNGNNISKSEQVSEDEAFHEDNDYIYGDRYDSVGESSVDDYHFTRHAILEYHRATTLKRLTRRTAGGIVIGSNIGVESNCQNHHQLMPDYSSLDTDLSPGYRDLTIEYESDSVNSLTGTGGGLGSTMLHSTVRIDDFDINAPLQDELQHHPHRFTSSPITNNTNVQCELCQKICQSSDDIVKCIECDLLCHTKCSLSINSKCFKSSVTNNLNQINKTGNLLTRHGSAYLPNEVDNGKLKQSNDTEKSSLNFGIAGAGGSLFNSTLPWRTERDHTFRSSLVLIHDKRGKRKLSESSSSLAHTNTSDCQSQSGQSLSGGGGGSTTIEHHLPEHLASASYYGYLYKLGHRKFLQQWKQRLFALDTNRHQLKYYESYANASPRGCIDLQDVRTVRIIKNFAIQRKSPSFVVFELETNNRTYKLGAINQESAMQWIERIQKTIQ
ncbi:myotubularin-related protein [Schistosoma mansoni]|uniref:myotubularin-related protein n=1 Tax=Schistosoma mansoni TaxID=6183 RepID=UPI00022DC0E8|nr:myotubularin-related protein [Schistosoma mansoni]|eukprot:XP_018651634.1 myotubularin-related protein [Schistosoma mansoni]